MDDFYINWGCVHVWNRIGIPAYLREREGIISFPGIPNYRLNGNKKHEKIHFFLILDSDDSEKFIDFAMMLFLFFREHFFGLRYSLQYKYSW